MRCWLLCLLLLIAGCKEEPFVESMKLGGVEVDAQTLNLGHSGFMHYCRPCHGQNGDGKGPLGIHQTPLPRNFQLGVIKYAKVPAGSVPRDEDIWRTLRRGLRGTPMLPWPIADAELHAIIQYKKTFSQRRRREAPPAAIEIAEDPWVDRVPEAVERGRFIYHGTARCFACHPAYLETAELERLAQKLDVPEKLWARDRLGEPVVTKSEHGYDIPARNFAKETLRLGNHADSLVWVIAAGIGGTAMPTWKGTLADADLWAVAHYVRHVAVYAQDRRVH